MVYRCNHNRYFKTICFIKGFYKREVHGVFKSNKNNRKRNYIKL